jgi:hypothetical protein
MVARLGKSCVWLYRSNYARALTFKNLCQVDVDSIVPFMYKHKQGLGSLKSLDTKS